MQSYHILWRETRLSKDDLDDVALFDIVREEERTWRASIIVSPLFRLLCMGSRPSVERRQEMAAGLGARAIVERLKQGIEPPDDRPLVLAINYPGSPGDPIPLVPYDELTVCVE